MLYFPPRGLDVWYRWTHECPNASWLWLITMLNPSVVFGSNLSILMFFNHKNTYKKNHDHFICNFIIYLKVMQHAQMWKDFKKKLKICHSFIFFNECCKYCIHWSCSGSIFSPKTLCGYEFKTIIIKIKKADAERRKSLGLLSKWISLLYTQCNFHYLNIISIHRYPSPHDSVYYTVVSKTFLSWATLYLLFPSEGCYDDETI